MSATQGVREARGRVFTPKSLTISCGSPARLRDPPRRVEWWVHAIHKTTFRAHFTEPPIPSPTGIALTALAGADGVASEISITVCACATTSPVCRVVNPTRIRVHLGIEMRVHDVRFEALHANVHHVQGSTQRWDVLLASSSVP